MSWSKQHFVAIAREIKAVRDEAKANNASPVAYTALNILTDRLSDFFRGENEAFDASRFKKAAGR